MIIKLPTAAVTRAPSLLLSWLRGLIATQKLALGILFMLPLIQAGFIGAEIGVPLIFNDPALDSAKSLYNVLREANGVVVAGAFFILFGGLIGLQVATSNDNWDAFVRQPWAPIAAVWICATLVLIGFEIAALLTYTRNLDSPLWYGLAVGIASGALMSAGLTWSTWWIGPRLDAKFARWGIPGLTLSMTILVDWLTNASALLMLIGFLVALRFCCDRLQLIARVLWLLMALTMAGIANSGLPFAAAMIGCTCLTVASVAQQLHWKTAALAGAALLLIARANVFYPVVGQPLVVRDPTLFRGNEAEAAVLRSAARSVDIQSAAVCDPHATTGAGAAVRRPGQPIERATTQIERVSPVQALENLYGPKAATDAAAPTVIAIAASGGGYRATFWTAVLLDEIRRRALQGDRRFATFARDARYLSGASGGMVALAYFAAMTKGGNWHESQIVEKIAADVNASASVRQPAKSASINSLQPVLQTLLAHDIPTFFGVTAALKQLREFSPWAAKSQPDMDRGIALDRQWQTIARPFVAAADDERNGVSPVLILTPAISETGEPLIISNFDLNDDQTEPCALPAQLKTRFPNSFADMQLNRAVRGNASFPRVSPIMAITEDRVQHVTDAGFVDNYGIDMIARLFGGRDVFNWMKQRKARLVILEIRAYATTRDRDGTSLSSTSFSTWQGLLNGALFHMTSTVQTLLNARTAGNTARAEQQIKLLKLAYAPASVETFVFESTTTVSMSWLLQAHELDDLRHEVRRGGGNVERELNRLADHLSGGHVNGGSSQPVE